MPGAAELVTLEADNNSQKINRPGREARSGHFERIAP